MMSEPVDWRAACESRMRDRQSASLHLLVRLSIIFDWFCCDRFFYGAQYPTTHHSDNNNNADFFFKKRHTGAYHCRNDDKKSVCKI